MDKKKILAIVLFLLMGFFMFTFANPSSKLEKVPNNKENTEEENVIPNENKVDETAPVVKPITNVVDEKDEAPVMTVSPEIMKVVEGTDFNLMDGVNVTDDKDSVTVKPLVIELDTLRIGKYILEYVSTADRSGQIAKGTRTLMVLDPNGDEDNDGYTNKEEYDAKKDFDNKDEYPDYDKNPSITLDEDNIYKMEVHTTIPTFEATATDVGDGKVKVIITHDINDNVVGKYTVTFKANDVLGNTTTIIKEFSVVDTTAPVIIMNGANEIVRKDNSYNDLGATATDNYDLDITDKILTNNTVNITVKGNYIVTYNVTDNNGNKATEVIRKVQVTSVDELENSINEADKVLENTKDKDIAKELEDLLKELEDAKKDAQDIIDDGKSNQKEIDKAQEKIDDILDKIYALEFTITFVDYDYSKLKIEKVKYSKDATAPINPERTGYTFTKWDKEFTNIVNNLTVKALYKINSYTVRYLNNGKLISMQEVEYGSDAIVPTIIPTKISTNTTNYTFKSWDKDGKNITSATDINAIYEETIRTYTVRYLNDGKLVSTQEVVYNGNAIVPAIIPTKTSTNTTNYTFKSWDKDGKNITSATDINAIYNETARTYTVNYYNGINLVSTQEVEYGSDAIVPTETPTKISTNTTNYTFKSWDKDGKNIVANTNIYAIYNETTRTYTVNYYNGADLVSTQEVEYGKNAIVPTETPTKISTNTIVYTFAGWDNNGTNITKSIDINATYIESTRIYTVVFKDYYGIILSTETTEYNGMVEVPNAPSTVTITAENGNKTVRRFTGWTNNFTSATPVTSNLEIHALYRQVSIDSTRVFVLKDGIERPLNGVGLDSTNYDELTAVTGLTIVDYNNEISEAIKVAATSSNNEGILALDDNVDRFLTEESKEKLAALNTDDYYYEWYVVKYNSGDGWHLDGQRMYYPVSSYTITYNLNGGTNSLNNPTSYTKNDSINLLNPTKEGNTFLGWYNESNERVTFISAGTTGNITLTAKWEENKPGTTDDYSIVLLGNKLTISNVNSNIKSIKVEFGGKHSSTTTLFYNDLKQTKVLENGSVKKITVTYFNGTQDIYTVSGNTLIKK